MKHSLRKIVGTTLATAGLLVTVGAVAGMALAASATPIVIAEPGVEAKWLPEPERPAELGETPTDAELDTELSEASSVPVTAEELASREAWLESEAIVRTCMEEKGFEYLYYEWWSPEFQRAPAENARSDGPPKAVGPEPAGMSPAEKESWMLALAGENDNRPYDWKKAGCWGYASHITGAPN